MIDWLLGGCCGPGGRLWWTASPAAVVATAALVAVLLLLAARPSPRGRLGELGLYALAVLAVAWMIVGPTWVQEGDRVEEGRFVVLVDASRSMGVLEGDGRPRAEAVGPLLGRLDAEVYAFGGSTRPGAPVGYVDGDTDLGGALDWIARRYAGERLEGIAVITDGLDRGGLRRRLGADDPGPLPRLGGPLTLYQVGTPGDRVDAAVTDLHAGGFAFLRAPFTIEARVRVVGTALREVPVRLTRDGQPVATLVAALDAEGRGSVRFTVTPDRVGRFLFEASVPLVEDDAVPANNQLDLAVRVVRDRVRVLQVSGSPSWDQKFLRLFLKEDPAVDLVSFFILRTPRDMGAGYDPSELSLIQFPYEQLFTTELGTFDLVVLQNFDYAPYFDRQPERLLTNLADYVREGGALVMIGGDRSFDLGKYGGTALAEVLPVRLGVSGDPVAAAAFPPRLTDAGARHPVTRLHDEPSENAAAWARLQALDGINRTLGPARDAAVLLEHPTERDPDGRPLPVVAVAERGRGRTMAITADASWRWSLGEAAQGRGNQAYLRFWKNAMRWLIGDPEDQPVVVEVGRENYEPGEEVAVVVRARDIGFAPLAGATVEVVVSGPGGSTTLPGTTGADGSLAVSLPAGERGAHRVKARVRAAGGSLLGEAETVYAVTTRDPELEEVEPDAAFLQRLAAATGGRYVGPGRWEEPLRDPESGRRVRDRRETPLATVPLVPLVAGLAASTAWWLRRRAGLR